MKNDVNILTATGYGATGSSAITHILSEFSNVKSYGDAEFWFLQDIDGISDLEYFLVDGNHRSKTFVAIKKFESYILKNKNFYSKFLPDYLSLSKEYLNSLKYVTFKKSFHPFEYRNSFVKSLMVKIYYKLQKTYHILFKKNTEMILKLPKNTKYHFIQDKKLFYKLTRGYTRKLFNSGINSDDISHLIIDQLVPCNNVSRYLNYIDNMKVIVVDRDPRDLFLLDKLVWKGSPVLCDTKDLKTFIKWYKSIRHNADINDTKEVLRLNFEDLVYDYDNSILKIIKFCQLDNKKHSLKKQSFNPKESINNTRYWDKTNKYKTEIEIIENELKEYCYEYKDY